MPATHAARRTLSKSRFKEGRVCPTRLFYIDKPAYGNARADDPFLAALAEGGFQVGALAQLQYPDGVMVETLDLAAAATLTAELLAREHVVIFEAAITHGPLLARVDVLVKRGSKVSLIEVKSKSFDPRADSFFQARADAQGRPRLRSDWSPYVADVGFQALVMRRAYPRLDCTPYLMLANRAQAATVDGLHQRFLLRRDRDGRARVEVRAGTHGQDLGAPLLCTVDAGAAVAALDWDGLAAGASFAAEVDRLAAAYVDDVRLPAPLGRQCADCPFRIDAAQIANGKLSGFEACWQAALGTPPAALRARPLVIDMGRLPHAELLAARRPFLADLTEPDLAPKGDGRAGLSYSERRWLQVRTLQSGSTAAFVDTDGLRDEMATWEFPLHMIDFETMAAALPFYRGTRPYEQVAFQFSHHTIAADGTVAHAHEWIEARPGAFPNFAFVRALRAAVGERGTIFRYADHENTVLCQILAQLESSEAPPADAAALAAFIRDITRAPADAETAWEGPRAMVDLLRLVKRYDYHPDTGGSNSLKYVLPAVLRASPALQQRYGQPIYGAAGGIASHNFVDHTWVRHAADGTIMDPYLLLDDVAPAPGDAPKLYAAASLRNGGQAMTAYARMQFTEMDDAERAALRAALLRYCELDTLAMVMLYEAWQAAVTGVGRGRGPRGIDSVTRDA